MRTRNFDEKFKTPMPWSMLLILRFNLFLNQNQMIRFFKNQFTKSFDSELKIFESESFDYVLY